MVNLFAEIVPEGGKEPAFLQRAPGLRLLATVGFGPIRGLWSFGNYGYVVSGNSLYKLDTAYTATLLGTIAGTGPVSMADNGTQLFVAANPNGYIYNATTNVFQQITDPDFPGAVTVGFIDGYFVFNEPNSQKLWITSLLDGLSVDPLDFASAEGAPDNIVSIIVDHREIWVFGTNSTEVWYDAGTAAFPLQRIQGAFNEIGCAAAYSVAKMDNSVFWLGADARGRGVVYRANGYSGQRISTHAVEWHIQQYGNLADAIGYTYQQDGHSFYVLIFPQANTTWVYDASTQAWHERAGWSNGLFTRHRSNCQMAFNNEIIVGDFENGNIYAFDLDVYADNGQIQKWLRSWRALPTGQNNLKRTAHHALQLDCEVGAAFPTAVVSTTATTPSTGTKTFTISLTANLTAFVVGAPVEILYANDPTEFMRGTVTSLNGTTMVVSVNSANGSTSRSLWQIALLSDYPQVMLRWSDDGGHTWSNYHTASIGKIGEYYRRVFWRRLGMTLKLRDRVYELSMTDPVKIAVMGAELQISGTNA
jgi:hypothetical protein